MERLSLIPQNKVLMTCVLNPFDPFAEGSRTSRLVDPGQTIRAMMAEFATVDPDCYEIAVAIDGVLINTDDRYDLCPVAGTSIVFAAAPHGGGNGNKNPLKTILQIVVVIVAAVATWYAGGEGGWAAAAGFSAAEAGAIVTGGMIVANVLINALIPPPSPDAVGAATSDGSKSSTYGWDVAGNPDLEGSALPILLGTVRITPPRIGKYVDLAGSTQYLNLLYAIADHELDSISDIRINENAINNYSGVLTEIRFGDNTQSVVQHFGDTRLDVPVGSKLGYGSWTTRRTSGNTVQGFGIGIVFPRGLYMMNEAGGLSPVTVNIAIEYRKVGDTDWTQIILKNTEPVVIPQPDRWSAGYYDDTGKWIELAVGETDLYAHQWDEVYSPETWVLNSAGYYVPVVTYWRRITPDSIIYQPGSISYPYVSYKAASNSACRAIFSRSNLEAGQYDVRAALYDVPSSDIRYIDDCYFEYLEEAVYDDFTYPGTALLAVRALATDQLSGGMPKIDCLATRETVPVWTGAAYENKAATNPAWASYHLLHSPLIGNVPYSKIVYADFLAWATWCDAQGYTVNIYIDQFYNLRKVLDMVSIQGRATVVQMGSKWTCIVDKPESLPVQRFLFTMGNIIKDSFAEEFLSMDDRATAIEVTYFDADLDYTRQQVTICADDYNSSTTEIKPVAVTLYGCTDRQQAIQYGKYMLNCNRYLTLMASWEADVDAIACLPGQVVEVAHDVPQWGYSGRIVSATADTVRLDRIVTMTAGKNYAIRLQHIDDDTIEEKTASSVIADPAWTLSAPYIVDDIVSHDGLNFICLKAHTATTAITTEDSRYWKPIGSGLNVTAWTKIPAQYAIYSFGELNCVSKLMRILKISRSQELRRKIVALEYVPEVYNDYAEIPAPADVSDLDLCDLSIHETWELGTDGAGQSVINMAWRGISINGWNVYYKQSVGNWSNAGWSAINNFKIYGLIPGISYTVCVSKTTPDKGLSTTITPQGKNALPSNVTNFTVYQSSAAVIFNWDHIPDIDLWGYEIRVGGSTWETATPIIDGEQKNTASWKPPVAGTYVFRIKAMDESGLYSATAASTSITTTLTLANIIKDIDELTKTPQADGTYTNMILCPTDDVIALIGGLTDTDEPTFTDTTPILTDFDGAPDLYGEYETVVYDIGAITDFTLRCDITVSSQLLSVTDLTIPDRTDRTYPNDTDTSITSNATYKAYYRTSSDNVTWTDYKLFKEPVDCNARYYQFKVRCDVDSETTSFEFSKIRGLIDVPDVDYKINNQAIGSSGTTITLASLGITIFVEYQVGVTVLGSSALYPVVNKESAQFTPHLFNSSGVETSGNVDIWIRGY